MPDLHRTYFLGAQGKHAAIFNFDGETLDLISELPCPPHAKGAVSEDGRFALIALDHDSIFLGRTDGHSVSDTRTVPLGDHWRAECATYFNGQLYLGGFGAKATQLPVGEKGAMEEVNVPSPAVALFDDRQETPEIVDLETPDFGSLRKWVDDLLVDGDRLIAIDNVVEPKYYFTYQINGAALTPGLNGMLALHGPYERIKACAIGDEIVVVLSHTSSGWDGYKHHLSLYNKDTMEQLISLELDNGGLKNAACICSGYIYFADTIHSIGRINIEKALHTAQGASEELSFSGSIVASSPDALDDQVKSLSNSTLKNHQSRDLIETITPDFLQSCSNEYKAKCSNNGEDASMIPEPIIAIKSTGTQGQIAIVGVNNNGKAWTNVLGT